MTAFSHSLLAVNAQPGMIFLLVAGIGLLLIAGGVAVWQLLGPGPRRRRAFHRAQRLLHNGDWRQAMAIVAEARSFGRLSTVWEGRLNNATGECRRAAGDAALSELRFEEALEHHIAAAQLLGLPEAEAHQRVVAAMLAEIRRWFATSNGHDTQAVHQLIDRLIALQPACPEAEFWRGLCHVRDGNIESAQSSLQAACDGAGKEFVDPPLYLGALLLRAGRGPEGLRHLAEANRREPNCAFVSWQLGTAIATAGQDASLAVRALQRALAAGGLPRLAEKPERAWQDGLPGPERSFVQRLAREHPFRCPLMGSDVRAMMRQANLALAGAYTRLGNDEEAAKAYGQLLQEAAPSLPVLRGLGLSLTRLGRHDEAFKHLRAAHELEDPKDTFTAGYLALCVACGRPSRPEDRPNNLLWAIRLLGRFDVRGNSEWARINGTVFAEARSIGLVPSLEDQRRLCDVLGSVDACNADAAAAFDQLAVTSPDAIRPEDAFLYCRAAQQTGFCGERDIEIFSRMFADAAARAFYDRRGWDFDEVEYTFLARWAERHPGRFPDVLGPDYSERGHARLLARADKQQAAGDLDGALATLNVLRKLA
ncbi:MAG TPA: tetratricopeptide repeat protein, partial [Gemmataceae bacterium]|nr:tetratricopeptide repeat protein [Gemmataceae bacterium]